MLWNTWILLFLPGERRNSTANATHCLSRTGQRELDPGSEGSVPDVGHFRIAAHDALSPINRTGN